MRKKINPGPEMQSILQPIFDGLGAPPTLPNGRALFAVAPVAGHPACFVGRDNDGKACILIAAVGTDRLQQAPIRLECLEVLFELPSFIRTAGQTTEGTFTVIRCRAGEREITAYFLSVCETIIRILGERPGRAAIANAVNRIAYIFRKLQSPPSKPLNGLFGELFVLAQSAEPLRAIAAWRLSDVSRFDFSTGDVRLDVKTAAGRVRAHTFSYDQCNPPAGTEAIAVSMFVERTAGGISLRELIGIVESRISADADLVIKLHDIVAATLGTAMQESLAARFDRRLAESSLAFFNLRSIPAIRGNVPAGVTDIHFRSDLSGLAQLSVRQLGELDDALAIFLPANDKQ